MRIDAAGPDDLAIVRSLVASAGLPLDGLGSHEPTTVLVARDGGHVVGTASLERHGSDGLVRSVAVVEEHRGSGVGSALTDAVMSEANAQGLRALYLLTETAPDFFAARGFQRIARDDAPAGVAASIEWSEACGESAIPMTLRLAD